jgi:hypothetical protein
MVVDSGNGVYGQNAIRALQGGRNQQNNIAFSMSSGSQFPFNAPGITQTNNDVLNQAGTPNLNDFNSEM